MAKKPIEVEIRGFQVGFGDCFLLSFIYNQKDKKHILMDFGTTGLPMWGSPRKAAKPSEYMPLVAAEIEKVCEGELTAVIATHRHADHISGFGTDARTGKSGNIIKKLKPKLVLQPWTEDPNAARDAKKATINSSRSRKSFILGLAAMNDIARSVVMLTKKKPAWMSATLQRELNFLGEDNIRNKSAVQNLMALGRARGARAVWAHYGSRSGLERLLPGVKVHILGPPDLTQTEKIKTMRKTDPDEFWHLVRDMSPQINQKSSGKQRTFSVPAESRWFKKHLDFLRGQQLLEIVRSLDDQMNNTSLIVLFEVFGKKLLFPGDAQIENWSYALQDAPDSARIRKLLADVDVYKVGHHGSLNATPKTLLWEEFRKRTLSKEKKLQSLLSTMPGKHGKTKNKTEVPRIPLLEALNKETKLFNTNKLPFSKDKGKLHFCYRVTVKP